MMAGAAATSSAYSAGVATGRAASPAYVMGAIYATLPSGCSESTLPVWTPPTTCAATLGSSRPTAQTAFTTRWCRLPEAARRAIRNLPHLRALTLDELMSCPSDQVVM